MANSRPLKSHRERFGFVVLASLIGSLAWLAHSGAAANVQPIIANEPGQTANGFGQHPEKNKNPVCPHCMPPGNQELYIPLMDLPEAEDGEMVFNSRSAGPMSVTPVFYKRNGQSTVCDPVQVEAGEIRYVPIKNLLPPVDRDRHDWGGFTLSFTGLPREMWSQFRFPHVNGGGSVDEFFTTKFEAHSKGFAGVWWMPEKSEAIVALGNITDKATSASVTFSNGHTSTIQLAPHATEILRENSHDAGAQSIKIDVIGDAGSVIPAGIITTKNGSFNSAIRFYDPSGAKQSNLFANGFGLRGITPHMVLKNTTDSSLAVLPKIIPIAGTTGLFVLPQVSLGPQESTEVDLSSLLAEAASRPDLDTISVLIEDYAAPGSIIGSLYGVDRRTQQNYEAPLRDSGPIRSMAGLYPWNITDDFRTVVYITNITDEQREFVAEATYDGGRFTMSPRKLAPRETAVIDLEALRRQQVKDALGRRLPSSASLGQFRWGVRGATNGKVTVIGRAQMVSRSQRISTSYSCHPDCGPNYDDWSDPYSCDISGTETCSVTAIEQFSYVDGQHSDPYPVWAAWYLDNSSIANLSPSSGATTQVSGNSSGSTTLNGDIGIQQVYDWDGMECIGEYDYMKTVSVSVEVSAGISKLQYQKPEGGNQDISGTIYVLKGTTVTFTAVPSPSGASFPSGKPTWNGSSGATGSGSTISVTFNTDSSSSSDFKTVVATASNTVTANVIVFEIGGILTPADVFSGRSFTRFGVHEQLTLTYSVTPPLAAADVGGLQWVQSSGNGTLSANTSGTGTYNVSDSPESASLKLTVLDGPSKGSGPTKNITIVAPSAGSVLKFSGVRHFVNSWSCGFQGRIFVFPEDVSFFNLFFKEEDVGATASGWLSFLSNASHGAGSALRIGNGNINFGSEVVTEGDNIYTGKFTDVDMGSYATGTVNWAIPWDYSVSADPGTWHSIATINQTATSTSTGRCTIKKDGSVTVVAESTDGTSEW